MSDMSNSITEVAPVEIATGNGPRALDSPCPGRRLTS